MRSILIVGLLLFGAAEIGINYRYRALAAIALTTPEPSPQPTPADDKCENCNGTGKLGDGRVFVPCPVCDGTGKAKNSQPPKEQPKQSILANPGAAATFGADKDKGAGKPPRTLRQQVKCVIYSMDGCKPCAAMHAEIEAVLPKAKWKLGSAVDFVEACNLEADFIFVHQPAGKETFANYPTVAIYRNGMMVRRYTGRMSARFVAEKWLEVYNEQLEARAK